jgi:hypothetical protein
MLQIKLLDIFTQAGESQRTASCQLTFGDVTIGIAMWEEDYEVLRAAGLFGKAHRPSKEGVRAESPIFIKPVAITDEDLLDRKGESFFNDTLD